MVMPADPIFPLPLGLRLLRRLPIPRRIGLLEKLYGQRLHALGKATVVLSNGHIWTLDLQEVTHRWLVFGDYEGRHQMQWLRQWLAPGGVFIDSGANIGQQVVSLSHLPGVRTLAFEPVGSERAWLERCLERYPAWPVQLLPVGLGQKEGEATIFKDGARSTLRRDWYVNRSLQEERIRLMPLDQIAGEEGIERIRLWKLDMEGFEPEALAGAHGLLSAQRIDALLIEAHSSTMTRIRNELAAGDYRLHRLDGGGRLQPLGDATLEPGETRNLIALPLTPQRDR